MESPCYELHSIPVEVTNPFAKAGDFQIILVENQSNFPGNVLSLANAGAPLMKPSKKKKPKRVRSKVDCGQRRPPSPVEIESDRTEEEEAPAEDSGEDSE